MLISEKSQVKYEEVSAPTGLDLDWAVLISKDFDGQPVAEIQLESEPLCEGKRIGDPSTEQLSISTR